MAAATIAMSSRTVTGVASSSLQSATMALFGGENSFSGMVSSATHGSSKNSFLWEDSNTTTAPLHQSDHLPFTDYHDYDSDDGELPEEYTRQLKLDRILGDNEARRKSRIESLRGYASSGRLSHVITNEESMHEALRSHMKREEISLNISALLDSQQIDFDSMSWRKEWIQQMKEQKQAMEALQFLDTSAKEYLHPLHDAEDPHVQRRRLSISTTSDDENCPDDDDRSVASTDSIWSISTWFSRKPARQAPSRQSSLISGRSGRRFIDLTIPGDSDDDYIGVSDDNDDDSDDDSIGTFYSIPMQKAATNKSTRSKCNRSEARKFLDLTLEVNGGKPAMDRSKSSRMRGKREGRFSRRWSGDGGASQSSLDDVIPEEDDELPAKIDEINHENAMPTLTVYTYDDGQDSVSGLFSRINDDDDDSSEDESHDEDEGEFVSTTDAWEKADAFIIQNVHEVARGLERQLNDEGIESPFWRVEQIFPDFNELHTQLKSNMILRHDIQSIKLEDAANQALNEQPKSTEEAVDDGPNNHNTNSSTPSPSAQVPRSMRRLSTAEDGAAFRRVAPRPADDLDLLGGYDDLGTRHLQRDDRSFLFNYMYDYRKDETCALPSSLVNGLAKDIPQYTTQLALDIINNLTSPLRRHRVAPPMETLNEETDEDDNEEDLIDRSHGRYKSTPSKRRQNSSFESFVSSDSSGSQEQLELNEVDLLTTR